ncbi:GNAT family N-acetyltransferase [Izhakiella australiensis]|uniref:GNAT family N-acetyltransferase n=1 Tax=Izhakiella australiensis TaxID=1926881 RepID=A0A1S8YK13_9GAMM|nr:GNAT family protein [Izhakiella australiensis]OON39424.1 GNAT family N-acetyltransferase [Izhakiella australiensis]
MTQHYNQFGQPVGPAMPDWSERPLPGKVTIDGDYCRIEPLDAARHGNDLFQAWEQAADGRDWTWLLAEPFNSVDAFLAYIEQSVKGQDPRHYAVIDRRSGKAVGTLALMRQQPQHGVIEVGHVTFSPLLKQSPLSSEAQFLLMRYVFDTLGYRRYEWKCDSLNAPSRRAALRLGFSYEGTFRQALVYKGRSRDTAWFSIIDSEWPLTKKALSQWLAATNFDAQGKQRNSLATLRQRLAGE